MGADKYLLSSNAACFVRVRAMTRTTYKTKDAHTCISNSGPQFRSCIFFQASSPAAAPTVMNLVHLVRWITICFRVLHFPLLYEYYSWYMDDMSSIHPLRASGSDSAVGELKVWPDHGQLWAEWRAPPSDQVSEYTVEWVSGKEMDWQRESNSTRRTALTGTGGGSADLRVFSLFFNTCLLKYLKVLLK